MLEIGPERVRIFIGARLIGSSSFWFCSSRFIEHQPDQDRNDEQNLCYQEPGACSRRLRRDNQYRVTPRDWQEFIQARSSGAVDLHGEAVNHSKRRPVGPRTVEKDLKWLKWVLNWGTRWSNSEGRYLLRENPVRGYPIVKEKNPKRPVATQNQFDALLAVADEVKMKVTWGGRAQTIRSHLRELLVVANGTGRRLFAICALTFFDLQLDEGPYGAIRWPADTDKLGRETVTPIGPDVRAAIDQIRHERPGIGEAPLFPAARDRTKPVHPSFAKKLLRQAVALADLEVPSGWGWHSFRRKFAIELKQMPDHDVAALGGWKSVDSLRLVYQQADQKTMLSTILSRRELREMRG